MNYKQIFARKKAREQQIKKLLPKIEDRPGIYKFYRTKDGKLCVYIGQATKSVLERCASHLEGYKKKNPTHIDLSLYTHKLATQKADGWKLEILKYCSPEHCNILEQQYISQYRKMKNVILYNITIGSQGEGKVDFQERNLTQLKRYKNGLNNGKIAVLRQVKVFFDKYLDFDIKPPITKIKQRKLEEFRELLNGTDNKKED